MFTLQSESELCSITCWEAFNMLHHFCSWNLALCLCEKTWVWGISSTCFSVSIAIPGVLSLDICTWGYSTFIYTASWIRYCVLTSISSIPSVPRRTGHCKHSSVWQNMYTQSCREQLWLEIRQDVLLQICFERLWRVIFSLYVIYIYNIYYVVPLSVSMLN